MSPADERIYRFIRQYVEREGISPSYREVADGCGLRSISAVHARLESLAAQGLIRHRPFTPRAIQILPREAA